jgi:hypothetical protein
MDASNLPGLSQNLWRHIAAMRSAETPSTERYVTDLAGSMAGPRTTVRTPGTGRESVAPPTGLDLGHVWRIARPSI